jgi:L-ascorbate metabolism protein UlaG (beta-lactamase superfamily)
MVDGSAPGQDRIAFMGHSTVLMRLAGEVLLTDPLLRPRVAHLRRYAPPAEAAEAVSAVLVSHAHQDHLDLPSLRAIGTGTPLIVPRGAGRWLSRRGFTAVTELAVGESASVGAVQVTAVPAHHDGRRYPLGPRSESVGYIARGSRSVYFAGDTGLFAEMSQLGRSGRATWTRAPPRGPRGCWLRVWRSRSTGGRSGRSVRSGPA